MVVYRVFYYCNGTLIADSTHTGHAPFVSRVGETVIFGHNFPQQYFKVIKVSYLVNNQNIVVDLNRD